MVAAVMISGDGESKPALPLTRPPLHTLAMRIDRARAGGNHRASFLFPVIEGQIIRTADRIRGCPSADRFAFLPDRVAGGRGGRSRGRQASSDREGNGALVAKEDKNGPARTPVSKAIRSGNSASDSGNVGSALRSVYDETVNEDIPGEMLDLLGKLA